MRAAILAEETDAREGLSTTRSAKRRVVPAEVHVAKQRAAAAARHSPETFIMARTDARAPLGLDEAPRRAEHYHKAGADGVYVEAVQSREELEQTARALRGIPLATSILEGGGRTPLMDPQDLKALGYSMVLYPTTVIFRVTQAIQKAVQDLKAGRPMPADDAVTFAEYEDMLGLPAWADLENTFMGTHDPLGVPTQGAGAVRPRSTNSSPREPRWARPPRADDGAMRGNGRDRLQRSPA